jgi:hypothetical protein
MRKSLCKLVVILLPALISLTCFAQSVTISGNVRNLSNKEFVPAVSVVIKGSPGGTFTDDHGNFRLTTLQKFPMVLVISSIGYETKENGKANSSGSASKRSKRQDQSCSLDIKPEMHYVSVLYDIFFSLNAQFSIFTTGGF